MLLLFCYLHSIATQLSSTVCVGQPYTEEVWCNHFIKVWSQRFSFILGTEKTFSFFARIQELYWRMVNVLCMLRESSVSANLQCEFRWRIVAIVVLNIDIVFYKYRNFNSALVFYRISKSMIICLALICGGCYLLYIWQPLGCSCEGKSEFIWINDISGVSSTTQC